MKTYPYQDGDRLTQLVEKRELDQLLERLSEARESHLHASARDVQTIQRQAIMLERLADALEGIASATCEKWEMPYADFKEQFMPWARNIALATLAKAKGEQL